MKNVGKTEQQVQYVRYRQPLRDPENWCEERDHGIVHPISIFSTCCGIAPNRLNNRLGTFREYNTGDDMDSLSQLIPR